jgi:hypothetical protein
MGAIINIFKSIIGLITGLFSKKSAAPAIEGQPAPAKAVKAKRSKDGFYMEAAAAPVTAASAAAPAAAATPTQKGGVPKQSTKGKVGQAAAAVAVAAASITTAPQPVDAVDLIRAALAATQSAPAQQAAQAESAASFAEMNAVPYNNGKRRNPGANMTGFLDMAKAIRKR